MQHLPQALPYNSRLDCSPTLIQRKVSGCRQKAQTPSKEKMQQTWNNPSVEGFLSASFSLEELLNAIKHLKTEKAQGPDNIPPELLNHCGSKRLS